MTLSLRHLRDNVLNHLTEDPTRAPLGGIGVFHSREPQSLHNVPIQQPLLVLVTTGRKIIALGERKVEVLPGQLLLLPGGCEVEVGNYPDADSQHYLGLAVGFPDASRDLFRRSYGHEVPTDMQPLWCAPAPAELVVAMGQWVEWCIHHDLDPAIARHRQVEMLLLLARAGIAGNLLLDRQAPWRERVAQLLALDPARDWDAPMVCRRLGIGESTLRRRLQEEGSGLRAVLEETRLVAGLALLQETCWPIGQVADAVGYRSQSRFSERFKRRFGLTPTELKKTRASGSGEQVSG